MGMMAIADSPIYFNTTDSRIQSATPLYATGVLRLSMDGGSTPAAHRRKPPRHCEVAREIHTLIADIIGKSGRAMIGAMIIGDTDAAMAGARSSPQNDRVVGRVFGRRGSKIR
jgi:hypothetical protein